VTPINTFQQAVVVVNGCRNALDLPGTVCSTIGRLAKALRKRPDSRRTGLPGRHRGFDSRMESFTVGLSPERMLPAPFTASRWPAVPGSSGRLRHRVAKGKAEQKQS